MKQILLLSAACLAVFVNAWMFVLVERNRSAATGGTAELTERELRLPGRMGDSTALFLDLVWDVPSSETESRRSPDWLTPAKLAELGFDCSVPATAPEAREHYAGMLSAAAYLVLEYGADAPEDANRRPNATRLFAVDAGLDAARLRERFPDPARHIILRAVVHPILREWGPRGARLPEPLLRGRIQAVIPDSIFVPRPFCSTLQDLRGREGDEGDREPRFAARISWGANHEPWVEDVRLLLPAK
jgi:hypothetical protein